MIVGEHPRSATRRRGDSDESGDGTGWDTIPPPAAVRMRYVKSGWPTSWLGESAFQRCRAGPPSRPGPQPATAQADQAAGDPFTQVVDTPFTAAGFLDAGPVTHRNAAAAHQSCVA